MFCRRTVCVGKADAKRCGTDKRILWWLFMSNHFPSFYLSPEPKMHSECSKNMTIQTLSRSRRPSRLHLKSCPCRTGTCRWPASMPLQSNNLPTLYLKSTRTATKSTKSSFRRASMVSCGTISLLFAGHQAEWRRHGKGKIWWCSKPSQAITIVIWKWDELDEVSSFKFLFLSFFYFFPSVEFGSCVGICKIISLFVFGELVRGCVLLVYYALTLPSTTPHTLGYLVSRLLLCCKRPDCPLNVFFYNTLHCFSLLANVRRLRLFVQDRSRGWHWSWVLEVVFGE